MRGAQGQRKSISRISPVSQKAQRARSGYKRRIIQYRPIFSQFDVVLLLLSRCNDQAKQNGSVKVDLRRIIDGRNKTPFLPRIDLISTARTIFDRTLLRRIACEVSCRR